jgi:hypothetical protein
LFFVGVSGNVFAQEVVGISVGYEFIPYVKFADPDPGMEDVKLQLNTISIGAAFPLSFNEGKTLLLNQLSYQRIGFNWKNWDSGTMGSRIDQAHSIKYTAFLIQTLNDRWKLVMVVVPGLASDFEGKVSTDDFTLDGIVGAMRAFGEKKNFTLGSGLAYTRDFGTPIPMPFLYYDWDISPKLSSTGLLPMNLEVTIAAIIVASLADGKTELKKLWGGLKKWRVHPVWYLFALFANTPSRITQLVSLVFIDGGHTVARYDAYSVVHDY